MRDKLLSLIQRNKLMTFTTSDLNTISLSLELLYHELDQRTEETELMEKVERLYTKINEGETL